ncbi:AIG1 family-domain-containing protein [Phycomyces nitens]|nr:AIG1 family-domain-containing protein [Phycomyces nitens]
MYLYSPYSLGELAPGNKPNLAPQKDIMTISDVESIKDRQTETSDLAISALGIIGTGKSSLLNAIAGEHLFETGNGSATTQTVSGQIRQWKNAPTIKTVRLIDTPGLCDCTAQDRETVHEMARYFKSVANGVTAFVLVFSIHDIRLDAYTQNMLDLFRVLLGKDFWNYVTIVFTHVEEDEKDELEANIEAVLDPEDGFVAQICDIYKLSRRTFVPNIVFVSSLNPRTSNYTKKCMRQLYQAVNDCHIRNHNKQFTCKWLTQIIHMPEDRKASFITESIKEAWSALNLSKCQIQ